MDFAKLIQRWGRADLLFLRSRVARRLFVLFVAAALAPTLVTGWVARELIGDASAKVEQQALLDTTAQIGQQILDRLLNARDLVRSWPETAPAGLPGLGRVFSAVSLQDAQGRTQSSGEPLKLARGALADLRPGHVQLLAVEGAGHPRIVLARALGDGRLWLAELSPAHLWAPLREAGELPSWRVYTPSGHDLTTVGDQPPAREPAVVARSRLGDQAQMRLPVGAEIGGEDWIVGQRRQPGVPTLLGVPFEAWLGLLIVASLVTAAWLSLAQIRRILVPLEHLTDVTRRLAAGDMSTHVEVDSDDEFDVLALAFNDMATRIRSREQELSRRATRDSLTSLANRHGLQLDLQRLLASANPSFGLFYIDLDNFKQVNDSQGHEAGDELLRLAAQRLTEAVPENAVVARLGGDEFVVVVRSTVLPDLQRYAKRCCDSLAKPFWLEDVEHFLGASVGVALAPEHGRDLDTLLRHADIAMYSAKRAGRNGHAVFKPDMDSEARARVQLNRELRHALERREFVLHFQPRVSTVDGHVSSAEALIRWRHPQRGLLMPGLFISVAEESDLIEGLGNWVLEEACAQYARWQREGVTLRRISVNVSPRQLASGKLPRMVQQMLARYRVPPQALELEVTESLLVGDVSRSAEQLSEVRRWGVTIALDDFGTGYSSLASLRQLPIDVIKIDRAFVGDLGKDESALAVVRAILSLADSLHLHTVAEGIETALQAKVLRELGCDEFQGYLFHKPMSVQAFSMLDGVQPVVGTV